MAKKASNGAAYRAYMRKHGKPPPAEATATETMLYIACLNYREHKFYRENETDMHEANRLMIRSLAVTLVWKKHPDQPVTLAEVKALEKDFMQRVKDDPPF